MLDRAICQYGSYIGMTPDTRQQLDFLEVQRFNVVFPTIVVMKTFDNTYFTLVLARHDGAKSPAADHGQVTAVIDVELGNVHIHRLTFLRVRQRETTTAHTDLCAASGRNPVTRQFLDLQGLGSAMSWSSPAH